MHHHLDPTNYNYSPFQSPPQPATTFRHQSFKNGWVIRAWKQIEQRDHFLISKKGQVSVPMPKLKTDTTKTLTTVMIIFDDNFWCLEEEEKSFSAQKKEKRIWTKFTGLSPKNLVIRPTFFGRKKEKIHSLKHIIVIVFSSSGAHTQPEIFSTVINVL